MKVLEVDNREQAKPCEIFGKRHGSSRALEIKARKAAGWVELTTPAELRAALPTAEDDASWKERNRLKSARRRARNAAGTVPKPKPASRKPADPFDASDLAADFLD